MGPEGMLLGIASKSRLGPMGRGWSPGGAVILFGESEGCPGRARDRVHWLTGMPQIPYLDGMDDRRHDPSRAHPSSTWAGGLIPKRSFPRCHETTCGRTIAEELGPPEAHVRVAEGDTDTVPYGRGTYATRSTPAAGAAGGMAARRIRDKAARIAAHLLQVGEKDLEWEPGQFSVKGVPAKSVTIQDCAFAAYTNFPGSVPT